MEESIEHKVEEYGAALRNYAECAAQENFSKQETLKARTRLNIAEEELKALRLDINDLVVAKTKAV